MSVNEKMTAIADKTRSITGETDKLGLDEIATNLTNAETEVDTQASLINQIKTALQNKASASEPVLQAKTVTPSTSSQTVTPDSNYDGLSKVTVNAIPSTYVKPTATKSAATYTPTTSNQTIAAGTYCSGAQTIKGDANLKAENIAEGVSIFGVTGTHSGGSSGGGGIETCTVQLRNESPMAGGDVTVYFVDGTQTVNQETFPESMMDAYKSITVQKNSLIVANSLISLSSGASIVATLDTNRVIFITDNTSLYLM